MKKPIVVKDLVYEEMMNLEYRENYRKYLETKEAAIKQLRIAALNLKNKGMSISEIAEIFNLQ